MAARTSPSTMQDLWQQEMDQHGDQLPLLLQPGENVRGIVGANFGWLVKDAPRRYVDPVPWWGHVFTIFEGDASDIQPLKRLLRLFPGMRQLSGGWRGQAGQFVIAAELAANRLRKVCLLVTDRRVLVVNGYEFDHVPLAERARVGEYRRDQLRLRPGTPRPPGRGVDLGFPDGSWVRMTGSALSQELLVRLLSS